MSVNQLVPSLNTNSYGVYYLRFRISKRLRRFFDKEYINKSLFTKDYKKAKVKAMVYRSKYIELLEVSDWIDDSTLKSKVDDYIKNTLKLITPDKLEVQVKEDLGLNLKEAFTLYDKWYKKQNVSEHQYKLVARRLGTAINYFGESKLVRELTTDDIEEYIDFLTTFPNPLKIPYKTMSFKEILKLTNVPQQDFISSSTVIKYIKAFRQLENFLVDDGRIDRKISKRAKLPTPSTVNVNPFNEADLKILYKEFDALGDLGLIYYTFAYTGMRTSEFWKCRIGCKDKIYYFDLSYKGVELKTASSRRKVPIHSKLIDKGILNSFKHLQSIYKQSTVSNTFNTKVINSIKDKKNKVMYGFRHTVATNLKRADVDIDKISEILGHCYENTSMTKTVYTNGYTLKQLKEAIECLV
ncbi:tyrosine-type recombinase/integrase [Aliarcobacter butzleri]|uniref:tyrosine-type recombinase/integrase n=1 Tax=Aliarcobacter butzleri TaxID=28197 RepID=UPI003B21D2BA